MARDLTQKKPTSLTTQASPPITKDQDALQPAQELRKEEGDTSVIAPLEDEDKPIEMIEPETSFPLRQEEVREVGTSPTPLVNPSRDINEIISSGDVEALNRPENLARLRFVIQRDILVGVTRVLSIHPDGSLDLITGTHNIPAPVGMRGVAGGSQVGGSYLKVSRDDFGREAGKYRVVDK